MRFLARVGILVGLLTVLGCGAKGPELGEVTGQIKMDGEPVKNAYVTFLPMFPGGIELVGKTDADGKYDVQYSADRTGVLLGKHQILLSTLDDVKDPDTGRNMKVPERFPAVYVNNDSPLYFEIKAGPNDVSFDVSSKPEKK